MRRKSIPSRQACSEHHGCSVQCDFVAINDVHSIENENGVAGLGKHVDTVMLKNVAKILISLSFRACTAIWRWV